MDTYMPIYDLTGTQRNSGDIKGALNYILLGGTHYFGEDPDAVASPYLGGLRQLTRRCRFTRNRAVLPS